MNIGPSVSYLQEGRLKMIGYVGIEGAKMTKQEIPILRVFRAQSSDTFRIPDSWNVAWYRKPHEGEFFRQRIWAKLHFLKGDCVPGPFRRQQQDHGHDALGQARPSSPPRSLELQERLVEHDPDAVAAQSPAQYPGTKAYVDAALAIRLGHILDTDAARARKTTKCPIGIEQITPAEVAQFPMNMHPGLLWNGSWIMRAPDMHFVASRRQSASYLIGVVADATALRRIFTSYEMPGAENVVGKTD